MALTRTRKPDPSFAATRTPSMTATPNTSLVDRRARPDAGIGWW
jgi:hypothetical protein